MKTLTIDNLEHIGNDVEELYLIKFSSPTCGPCQSMKPVFTQLEKDNPNLDIYEVDTSISPELAQHFTIRSVPTIHFCKGREILYTFNGATPLGNLQYVISNINDPYFLKHGEFKDSESNKSYVFPMAILGLVVLFLGLFFLL
mgnify:CR=1 FL=1|jgi:thioredoxin 1